MGKICATVISIALFAAVAEGEQKPDTYELSAVRDTVRPFATVGAVRLDSVQLAAISALSGVPPSEILTFRWAPSAAPAGHPDHDSIVYVVWRAADGGTPVKATFREQHRPETPAGLARDAPPEAISPPAEPRPQPQTRRQQWPSPLQPRPSRRKSSTAAGAQLSLQVSPLFALPLADLGSDDAGDADPGFGVVATTAYAINPNLVVTAATGYLRWGINLEDENEFAAAFLNAMIDAHWSAVPIVAGLRYRLVRGTTSQFFKLETGVYRMTINSLMTPLGESGSGTDSGLSVTDEIDLSSTETQLGISPGLGFERTFGNMILAASVDYTWIQGVPLADFGNEDSFDDESPLKMGIS